VDEPTVKFYPLDELTFCRDIFNLNILNISKKREQLIKINTIFIVKKRRKKKKKRVKSMVMMMMQCTGEAVN